MNDGHSSYITSFPNSDIRFGRCPCKYVAKWKLRRIRIFQDWVSPVVRATDMDFTDVQTYLYKARSEKASSAAFRSK